MMSNIASQPLLLEFASNAKRLTHTICLLAPYVLSANRRSQSSEVGCFACKLMHHSILLSSTLQKIGSSIFLPQQLEYTHTACESASVKKMKNTFLSLNRSSSSSSSCFPLNSANSLIVLSFQMMQKEKQTSPSAYCMLNKNRLIMFNLTLLATQLHKLLSSMY